jgi:hypothetical protein
MCLGGSEPEGKNGGVNFYLIAIERAQVRVVFLVPEG